MKTCAEIFWSESVALGSEYRKSQGAEDYVGASYGELGYKWSRYSEQRLRYPYWSHSGLLIVHAVQVRLVAVRENIQ